MNAHSQKCYFIPNLRTALSTSSLFKALTETDCERKVQDQFGIEYKKTEDSFVIFEAQLLNPSAVVMYIILLAVVL